MYSKIKKIVRELHHQYSHVKHRNYFRKWVESDEEYTLRGYEQLKCVFIHIPKTGGISVSRSLFGNLGGGHKDVKFYKRAFGPLTYDKYFSFAFVRNPYTRLYSAYSFLKRGGFDQKDMEFSENIISKYPTFEQFIEEWLSRENIYSYNHFIPQYTFLCDGSFKPEVDFIGRFENIEEDFQTIAKQLGVSVQLPHHNQTVRKKKPLEEFMTNKLFKKVAKVYSEDFEIFEYSKYKL